MVKKNSIVVTAVLILSYTVSAQVDFGGGETKKKEDTKKDTTHPKKNENEKSWTWSKVRVGGGLGLSFGQVTFVNLSPTFGYQITERYQAGIGVTYIYFEDNSPPPFGYRLSIYGGSIYNKFNIYKEFVFAYAEYQALNSDWNIFSDNRFYIHNVWVGGGVNYSLGGRSSAYVMALWNINDSNFSPFRSPDLRIGFGIGF